MIAATRADTPGRAAMTPQAGPSSHRWRWAVLSILCVTQLLISLDLTILNVALPAIVTDLHATSSQLEWIVDAYAVAFAGLLLTLGALGDRAELDELGEFTLRMLQSLVLDPGTPRRSGSALRGFLRRWAGPAIVRDAAGGTT